VAGPFQARQPQRGMDLKPGRAMRALGELLRSQEPDPFALFDVALGILVRQFMVDHALITRLTQGRLDTFWWVDAGTGAREPIEVHQSLRLCQRVLDEPGGTLALGTVFASEGGPWLQAFAGVALREADRPIGTLAVMHGKPFAFHDEDLDLLRSVAGLLSRALEIENLRYQLQVARDSLALSTAVAQDSALENPETGIANARYLDIWMNSHLPHARRQRETCCLIRWQASDQPTTVRTMRRLKANLRADDLLVQLGPGSYLMVLPQTPPAGASDLLSRNHGLLGATPMGATLWMPDRDDLQLRGALGRAEQARQDAVRSGGGLAWKLGTPS